MSNTVELAVKEICDKQLTPGYYMGMKDRTVDKRSAFWRDFIFPRSNDIVHDKKFMFWHEFNKKFPMLMPTDICPCDEGDYIATSDSYIEKMVSMGYWWLGFPIDCDFEQFLKPGECPYTPGSFQEQVRDYFNDLREKLFMGFDQKEEYWAACLAMDGVIEVHPDGGKPYEVHFKRDDDLNCVIEDPACQWCQDPKKGDVTHRPWDDIRIHIVEKLWDKNRGFPDTIIMNRTTCNWMRNAVSQMLATCKDVQTAQILLPHMISLAGYDVPLPMDGAALEFVMPMGNRNINIYCVDTTFTFCDPVTSQEVCVNPLEDGKVYAYNINGGGNNEFDGRFAYGRIHNFNTEVESQKRFFHQHIEPSGKSLKYHGESAPMALITCPNGSVCLDVCGGDKKAKTAAIKKGN